MATAKKLIWIHEINTDVVIISVILTTGCRQLYYKHVLLGFYLVPA